MIRNLNTVMTKLARDRRGQGMVEYALLVAGVALVCVVGVSMMGHKTADLVGTTASVLPGAHDDDNGPIQASQLVETQYNAATGTVQADSTAISSNGRRLNANLGLGDNDDAFVSDGTGGTGGHD